MAISVFWMVPGVFAVRSCWFFHQMAWFDPLNNSGGVSFDFFDFTYLSIPPIYVLFPLNLKCLLSSFVEVLVISCAQAVHKKIECYLSGPFWHLNHKKHHEGSKRSPLSFADILGILSDRRLVQRLWDILCFKLSRLSWLLHRLQYMVDGVCICI